MVAELSRRSRPGPTGEVAARPNRRIGRSRGVGPPAPWGYLLGALVILALISVYPLIELVRIAFSNVGPSNLVGTWSWVGLANFRTAIDDPELGQAVRITVELTAILLVSDLVIGFVVASLLAAQSRTTSVVLSLMVFVWAMPPLVSGSVWNFLLSRDGAVNDLLGTFGVQPVAWLSTPTLALWSVGLVTAWAALPFATLVLRGGMLAVPQEVIEASAIDGAGYWQTQIRIVLPLLRPTLAILSILAVLYSFQGFNFIYALTSGGPGSATVNVPFLAYQKAFTTFDLSAGGAIALLAVAFVVILAVPYARSLRREQSL